MTMPGVNVMTAAALMAAIGDIAALRHAAPAGRLSRAGSAGAPVGLGAARHGRISKRGDARRPPRARSRRPGTAARTPGPLRAFGERIRARRGAQIAAVAVARKIAVIAWHMLGRDEDYAFARPSPGAAKLRRARAARRRAAPAARHAIGALTSAASTEHERELQPRPSAATGGWSATGSATEEGCGRDTGARISKALEGHSSAADLKAPDACALARQSPAPHPHSRKGDPGRPAT